MVFVAVVRANELGTTDLVGKGDPYIVVKHGSEEKKTKAKSGKNPSWDEEHFNFNNRADKLYILHKDKDIGADNVVAFAAIDLNRLDDVTNGWFPLYTLKDQRKGTVLLNIGKQGKPHSLPSERQCESFVDDELRELVRKINRSANVRDGVLGAGMALGAGFLGKKVYDHQEDEQRKREEEERRRREEEERRQEEQRRREEQQREEQRRREEQQREEQHRRQQQEQQHQQQQPQHPQQQQGGVYAQQGGQYHQQQQQQPAYGQHQQQQYPSTPSGGSGSNYWEGNFVHYKAGQVVEFNGCKYRVLQSHASQNDWAPNVAHSLFERV